LISERGLCSRREADSWVREGRIKVNGSIQSEPGTTVDPEVDHIKIDGRRLPVAPRLRYFMMFKPRGYLVTRSDPEGRRTVQDLMPGIRERLDPVGRLDLQTEGLLLFTNDGELAHRLVRPSGGLPRRYLAKVWRMPTEKTLNRLRNGVQLEEGRSGPSTVRVLEVTQTGNAWLEIIVKEGRNRLVRRMLQAVNHPVSKLRREGFGPLQLGDLERGVARELTHDELKLLRAAADGQGIASGHADGKPRRKAGWAKPKPKKRRGGKPRSKAIAPRKRS
jgi:23S rRNA pseudouridine2605 synthase